MQLPADTFHKTARDDTLTDSFLDSCVQVFYDAADTVEYLELSRDGAISAIYDSIDVFATPSRSLTCPIATGCDG